MHTSIERTNSDQDLTSALSRKSPELKAKIAHDPVVSRPLTPILASSKTPSSLEAVPTLAQKFHGKVVFVGFGLVAQSVSTLILKHLGIKGKDVTIITADERGKSVAAFIGAEFIVTPLTRENYRDMLAPRLANGDLLLNLSVDVGSLDLVELCQELGAFYVDTCIEPWAGEGSYSDASLSLAERSNYALREKALEVKKKYPNGRSAVIACGANPGMVSFLVKQALVNLANDTGLANFSMPKTRAEWADLAARLNVKVVHIAERDTQFIRRRREKQEFVNTWSVDGFISEAVHQPAELGWGSHEKQLPADGHYHKEGCGAAIYLDRPGGATQVRTWTPLEGPFQGFLVTHNEAISISDYYTKKEGEQVLYRPTCHYAYHPCDDAVTALKEVLARGGEEPPIKSTVVDEVQEGVDELGVLLMGHAKGAYWFGSVVSVEEARRVAPFNNATSLQVCGGILAAITHVLENPNGGIIESDEMDHVRAMEVATPYLGSVVGAYSDWTPLKHRPQSFPLPQHTDLSDPWQFSNFRVE